MISLEQSYHTGFVVPELEPAMAELTALFGISWTGVEDRSLSVVTPEGPLRARLRFVYSVEGPHHIELMEPAPGTIWEQPLAPGSGLGAAHHFGVWADDFAATSERLVDEGFPRVLTFNGGDGKALGCAYHQLASGALIELVDASRRDDLEQWFCGGPYPSGRAPSA